METEAMLLVLLSPLQKYSSHFKEETLVSRFTNISIKNECYRKKDGDMCI